MSEWTIEKYREELDTLEKSYGIELDGLFDPSLDDRRKSTWYRYIPFYPPNHLGPFSEVSRRIIGPMYPNAIEAIRIWKLEKQMMSL